MFGNPLVEASGRDAWLQTVSWLQGSHEPAHLLAPQLRPEPSRPFDPWQPLGEDGPTIRLLERPTPKTVAVSWSSPGACHYGYQIWHQRPAKSRGVCVVTGRAIRMGELIYSPRHEAVPPANLGEMMAYECVQVLVPETL